MNSENMQLWQSYHAGKYKTDFEEDLKASWDRCYAIGVDPETLTFHTCSEQVFKERKKESLKLYAYANRLLICVADYIEDTNIGFALFDKECCLMKRYGSLQFTNWADSKEIVPGSIWSEDKIGTNSVSIGISQDKDIYLPPARNYAKALADTAVYFSSVSVEKLDSSIELLGGLAILCPIEEADKKLMMSVIALTKEIRLHYSMTVDHFSANTNGSSRVAIDCDKNNKKHFLYYNATIFNVLEIPEEDLFLKSVDTVFDLRPKNMELWDIVEHDKIVKDLLIQISIRGQEQKFLLTTEPYRQTKLGVRGMKLDFDSPKRIASYVSKKVGNSAVLTFSDIIGENISFKGLMIKAKKIAQYESNLLILGESGVGKDIFAQAIHNASDRNNFPFIALNCASFPRDLIASELFGYEAGAFTGSKKGGQTGKFELANKGTIFLDEIGDMPLELQSTLLRIIEQKRFMRIGATTETEVDVRIIAATNANLKQKIEQKLFREDLYYRLSTLKLKIPPLRDRNDDIPNLVAYFSHAIAKKMNRIPITFTEDAIEYIVNLPWKGNVRELQSLIINLSHLYPSEQIKCGQIIEYFELESCEDKVIRQSQTITPLYENSDLKIERKQEVLEALKENRYNKKNTAAYLGIGRSTLYRLLKDYNIIL